MADDVAALERIKANIIANLEQISAKPKPSYSVDGQSISWESLFNSYMNQLDSINAKINQAAGPFELHSEGYSGDCY